MNIEIPTDPLVNIENAQAGNDTNQANCQKHALKNQLRCSVLNHGYSSFIRL